MDPYNRESCYLSPAGEQFGYETNLDQTYDRPFDLSSAETVIRAPAPTHDKSMPIPENLCAHEPDVQMMTNSHTDPVSTFRLILYRFIGWFSCF